MPCCPSVLALILHSGEILLSYLQDRSFNLAECKIHKIIEHHNCVILYKALFGPNKNFPLQHIRRSHEPF